MPRIPVPSELTFFLGLAFANNAIAVGTLRYATSEL